MDMSRFPKEETNFLERRLADLDRPPLAGTTPQVFAPRQSGKF